MEEILRDIYTIWADFWAHSSLLDKILAVSNTLGASYTFVLAWIVFQRIDDYVNKAHSIKLRVANASLLGIMIGSFFSAIVLHVPDIPQATMHAGMSVMLTIGYLVLKKYKSEIIDAIE